MTFVTMVKPFNGFDFWEQRIRAQQGHISEVESGPESELESDIESEPCSPVETPDIHIEALSPAKSLQTWSQPTKPDGIVRSRPILIQTVGVHDVRNSMSFSPSLDHHSHSVSVSHPNSYEEKGEFLTVIKTNDSFSSRRSSFNASPMEKRRSEVGPSNNTTKLRRSPLKLQTTNLSRVSRYQQRHSALPSLPTSTITPSEHRHTFNASADCTPCVANKTDKAFEALANALQPKQIPIIEPVTILRPSKDSPLPIIRSPTPIRPKIISQHLEKAQLWAESQEDFDSSTASSLSSPMSPMMSFDLPLDNKNGPVKTEIVPMGCNLDHDLDDFLKWEAKHVCAYGYGTNGWAFSP
ncbi:unnamed protein product [Fusarium venenatum]|uniref:Uncharacterized protein n=1 Tax=Fusarium venenatum TaxID=56646 RepID=A0A2L2T488_9HYPO|nr:uncharacterized protein FVRRES_02094 [Fusarium venenatum]KAH7004779.1 hypothetical protein EDB82DRAFT_520785 [Fusarium venenatum]CEI65582.1 unnamed protein product [Fusarium venenatum]